MKLLIVPGYYDHRPGRSLSPRKLACGDCRDTHCLAICLPSMPASSHPGNKHVDKAMYTATLVTSINANTKSPTHSRFGEEKVKSNVVSRCQQLLNGSNESQAATGGCCRARTVKLQCIAWTRSKYRTVYFIIEKPSSGGCSKLPNFNQSVRSLQNIAPASRYMQR